MLPRGLLRGGPGHLRHHGPGAAHFRGSGGGSGPGGDAADAGVLRPAPGVPHGHLLPGQGRAHLHPAPGEAGQGQLRHAGERLRGPGGEGLRPGSPGGGPFRRGQPGPGGHPAEGPDLLCLHVPRHEHHHECGGGGHHLRGRHPGQGRERHPRQCHGRHHLLRPDSGQHHRHGHDLPEHDPGGGLGQAPRGGAGDRPRPPRRHRRGGVRARGGGVSQCLLRLPRLPGDHPP